MRSTSANVIAATLIAAQVAPSFAAPIQGNTYYTIQPIDTRFPPAVKAIGAAVAGGIASGAAGAATDAILNREYEARFPPAVKAVGAA
ncbi:hypothetical protein OF83DRAFT_1169566, partial [Amylostereum chailletii]